MDSALPHQQGHQLGSGILRLNSSLRKIIYEHLGAHGGRSAPKVVRSEGGGYAIFSLTSRRSSQVQPRLRGFHGLLLSCRVIYNELSRMIYSTNSFVIKYSGQGSLEPLRNLRPQNCAFLASLRIILAESSCFQRISESGDGTDVWPCCKKNPENCSTCRHGEPINALDARLAEWDTTSSHLASTIGVGTLDLALVCDVSSGPSTSASQAARSVTTSILCLPRLKHCSIRLCKDPDRELQQLADETVLRARHLIPPCSPWTPSLLEQTSPATLPGGCGLLTLPAELRLRILQYTDLITPWKEVWWSPQHQHFVVGMTYCEDIECAGLECPPTRHYGCQFRRCDVDFSSSSSGCFCRKMHSAVSSKAACRCWETPQALFLICKTLYKDAQAVFYSENRFVVFDRYSDPPWRRDVEWDDPAGNDNREGYPYPRLGVSRFLRDIVPTDCLQHLRFLEIVYPAWDDHIWPQAGQSVLQEWSETLDLAWNHLNVGGLTVRMIAMDASDWEQPLSRTCMTREQGVQVILGYLRLLGPLKGRGELRRFYAQLVSPWRWNNGSRGTPEASAATERMLKERAETLVMGDRYVASENGLEEPTESVWHHCYERSA